MDAPGDDLRKNVLPLPVREPSAVLFQLIGFLTQYAERIVSATELQMGENIGQNTPAETARTMNENGSRVYNAIFKRNWRALRDEFDIQYALNGIFLEVDQDYTDLATGKGAMVLASDYKQKLIAVSPAADPHVVSDGERVKQAQTLVQMANSLPGFNRYRSTLRLLSALYVSNIEEVYPQPMTQGPDGKPVPAPDFPPPPDPKMLAIQIKQGELQLEVQKFRAERQDAVLKLKDEASLNIATIMELYAKAELELAEAKGVPVGHQIAIIEAQIGALKQRNEGLFKALDLIQKGMTSAEGNTGNSNSNAGAGLAAMVPAIPNPAVLAPAAPVAASPNGAMGQPPISVG